jgi:hypothetical protein
VDKDIETGLFLQFVHYGRTESLAWARELLDRQEREDERRSDMSCMSCRASQTQNTQSEGGHVLQSAGVEDHHDLNTI